MISIFGPKSFNSFGALKKFAICFRQHPMVTMWQTLFSTNFFENSLTKHIFSSFQNTIRYAKRQAKAFVPFHPQELVCQQRREKCFRKVPSDQSKVFFFSKLTHNQQNFRLSQCVLFLKRKCSLFDKLSKSEHCLFHSF